MKRISKINGDSVFDFCNVIFMCFIILVTLYPFYYVIISSLNDPIDLIKGPVYLWPRDFSIINYQYVLRDEGILRAAYVTVARTFIGSVTACLLYTSPSPRDA